MPTNDQRAVKGLARECRHTEHARRGSVIVGRWFSDMNDRDGSWEPCPAAEHCVHCHEPLNRCECER